MGRIKAAPQQRQIDPSVSTENVMDDETSAAIISEVVVVEEESEPASATISSPQKNGRETAAASLRDRLQQLLDIEQAKQQDRRNKRMAAAAAAHRQGNQKKSKSQNEEENETEFENEVTIVQEEEAAIYIDIRPQSNTDPSTFATKKESVFLLLRSWTLPPTTHLRIVHCNLEKGTWQGSDDDSDSVPVSTMKGVEQVLEHFCLLPQQAAHLVGQAIQSGTLVCKLRRTSKNNSGGGVVHVELSLDPLAAISAGDPNTMIVYPKGNDKQQPATLLTNALGVLLEHSYVQDVIQRNARRTKSSSTISAQQVYQIVDNAQYNNHISKALPEEPLMEIPGLVPTLRPYQQAAVQWMLQRERQDNIMEGKEWELAWTVLIQNNQDDKTGSWGLEPLHLQKNKTTFPYYYCPYLGWWTDSYEKAKTTTVDVFSPTPKGGILAESMGLGKTVEVLACILAHPMPPANDGERRQELPMATSSSIATSTTINNTITTTATTETACVNTITDYSTTRSGSSPPSSPTNTLQSSNDEDSDHEMELPERTTTPDILTAPIRPLHIWNVPKVIGACICGQTIDISDMDNKKRPIVVCRTCQEPMHAACADLLVEEEETTTTTYDRVEFCHRTWRLSATFCEPSHCPCCVAVQPPIHSRATLIVTPPAILNQWEREIQRHTNITSLDSHLRSLKVVVYPGIRPLIKPGKKLDRQLLHPKHLGDADIVLMTFESLMTDLGHSDSNRFVASSEHGLRQRKLYRVVPSPLLSIRWWRVCLDEAQRVETPTAASAQMALKLSAKHSWCVSGTPVHKGQLQDVYGLLLFLRLQPFDHPLWFQAILDSKIRGIDNRIFHLLQDVFWRSTKANPDVKEQMGVPDQIEKKVVLEFSSIERHFYQLQLEKTLNLCGDLADRQRQGKNAHTLLDNLSIQMHRLRAACCHPQVGASGLAAIGGNTRSKRGKKASLLQNANEETTAYSRILTMDQILDRLIDDSKLSCEEAQRLFVMHNNAMAALSKLKVQAKERVHGQTSINESNQKLVATCCKLYMESLKIIEENAKPSPVIGEGILSGCTGFQSSQKLTKSGETILLDWRIKHHMSSHGEGSSSTSNPLSELLWAKIDFEGPAKRITQLNLRPLRSVPKHWESDNDVWGRNQIVLFPKTCVLQVLNAALGAGEFVDVATFHLPSFSQDGHGDNNWTISGGFRTNKSKAWKITVLDYHNHDLESFPTAAQEVVCGLEMECFEPYIGGDSLQRLHCLHNATGAFRNLLEVQEADLPGKEREDFFLSENEIQDKLKHMVSEEKNIEKLYMDGILHLHEKAQTLFREEVSNRQQVENRLFELTRKVNKLSTKCADCFDDEWWIDLLSICAQYGSQREQFELCKRVHEDLNSVMIGAYDRRDLKLKPFPQFNDVHGLYNAVILRTEDLRLSFPSGGVEKCKKKFLQFSSSPSTTSVIESATCQRCKKDWTWEGQCCSHCQLSIELNRLVPDRLFMIVLTSIQTWMKGGRNSGPFAAARSAAKVDERARLFFDVVEVMKKEKSKAEKAWRVHLDLLNDLDELNMCKQAMRLSHEGEDLTKLAEAELNAVVYPMDVASSYHDHAAKQAMAFANLRRHSDTLRFLKNQKEERSDDSLEGSKEEENCIVCLCPFRENRAVLSCGHCFHYSPCLEKLMSRPGNQHSITCPLRCTARTKRSDILMATDKRRDDGTVAKRKIQGSWGTKVTRLVGDVLDVCDRGEKSIVFSMWEDMLDVLEEALVANSVTYVRATSLRKVAESTKRFRCNDCTVLLLNVKNGAEGLTLVEASHVFMVEPLLNCGLDSQGTFPRSRRM